MDSPLLAAPVEQELYDLFLNGRDGTVLITVLG